MYLNAFPLINCQVARKLMDGKFEEKTGGKFEEKNWMTNLKKKLDDNLLQKPDSRNGAVKSTADSLSAFIWEQLEGKSARFINLSGNN